MLRATKTMFQATKRMFQATKKRERRVAGCCHAWVIEFRRLEWLFQAMETLFQATKRRQRRIACPWTAELQPARARTGWAYLNNSTPRLRSALQSRRAGRPR